MLTVQKLQDKAHSILDQLLGQVVMVKTCVGYKGNDAVEITFTEPRPMKVVGLDFSLWGKVDRLDPVLLLTPLYAQDGELKNTITHWCHSDSFLINGEVEKATGYSTIHTAFQWGEKFKSFRNPTRAGHIDWSEWQKGKV